MGRDGLGLSGGACWLEPLGFILTMKYGKT